MRTQLFSRNVWLGVLMAVVLALGVQGTADAITKFTRGAGDLKTYAENEPFTVSFSVGVQSAKPKPNYEKVPRQDTDGNTVTITAPYYLDTGASGYQNETQVSSAEAHYYDQESITITAENANITKVGSYDITPGLTHTMTDGGTNATLLTRSVTVTLSASSAEVVGITISDETDAGDREGDEALDLVFTVYVTEARAPDTAVAEWGFTSLTNGYRTGGVDHFDEAITTASTSAHVRTEYKVVSGSGRLYVMTSGANARKGSATRTLSTSSAAAVHLDMSGTTNVVEASISGVSSTKGIFIFGHPSVTIVSGNPQEGVFGGRLDDPLVVSVKDGKNRAIPGLAAIFTTANTTARFIPVPGTTVYTNTDGVLINTLTNLPTAITEPASTSHGVATAIIVQTDSRGEAKTYFQLGTAANDPPQATDMRQSVTVQAGGSSLLSPFRFEAGTGTRKPVLKILSGNNQRTDENGELEDPLVVLVTQGGFLKPGEEVTFRTKKGTVDSNKRVVVTTNSSGQAEVVYEQDPGSGSDTVIAEISDDNYEREVIFGINGGSTTGGGSGGGDTDGTPPPATIIRTLDIDVSPDTGSTRTVTVTALQNGVSQTGTFVNLSVSGSGASLSRTSGGTPLESQLTLPQTAGTYTLTATTTATGYSAVTEDVEVILPGTLTISTISPTTGAQTVSVTARRNGSLQSGVNFTISGSGIVPARGVTTAAGSGNAILNFPNIGTYALTVRAEGYTDLPVSVTISTAGQQTTTTTTTPTTTTTTGTAGQADSIEIDGSRSISGTVNQATRLRVRVLDANNRGVSGVRVTFKVLAPGQGRLSQRGNGRASQAVTDRSGYATASLTPLGGNLIVEAKAARVSSPVTFIINVDGASDTGTDTDATSSTTAAQEYNVRDEIPISLEGTLTFSGSRTLNGITYTCVGSGECVVSFGTVVKGQIQASPEKTTASQTYKVRDEIPISLEDTLSFTGKHTVNGTIYTCVGNSGECVVSFGTVVKGEIRVSAASATTTPRTTEINPEVLLAADRRPPMVWVDGGGIYTLVGADVQEFSPSVENVMNIAVSGDTLYWTAQTGENAGTINSVNLDGTGAKELVSIHAVPRGIAVDSVAQRLYWTNSQGWIQSSNLEGTARRNVAKGLGSPGGIALSANIKAPVAKSTPPKSTTTAANNYDVNGDGTVDSKDSDALIVAVAAGITDAKYDVNGDGKVDVNDVVAVTANRNGGAAGAPTLLGMKFSAIEVDRLQEQIDLLIATNDRSPAAMRTLVYLQQLLVMARPEQTQLLANYPNPFNPETWIPYELATDTNVKLTIYNAQGVVVRVLQLGQQSAGYYTDRERAAYWDGRNALGEQVASGIYFYQLETDDMSSLRKMVILK